MSTMVVNAEVRRQGHEFVAHSEAGQTQGRGDSPERAIEELRAGLAKNASLRPDDVEVRILRPIARDNVSRALSVIALLACVGTMAFTRMQVVPVPVPPKPLLDYVDNGYFKAGATKRYDLPQINTWPYPLRVEAWVAVNSPDGVPSYRPARSDELEVTQPQREVIGGKTSAGTVTVRNISGQSMQLFLAIVPEE